MNTRVLIDGRKLGDGGIGVYIETLVDGLLELSSARESKIYFTVLVEPENFESGSTTSAGKPSQDIQQVLARWRDQVQLVPEPSEKYSLSEHFLLPRHQRKVLQAVDLFHSPHFTLPYGLQVPSVVTVHDVIHVSHPERWYYPALAKTIIRSSAARAAHVISVSQESSDALQLHIGVDARSITVVPNSVRFGLERQSASASQACLAQIPGFENALGSGFLLFVGSDRPHKGFRELLLSFGQFKKHRTSKGETVPSLVVVGSRFASDVKRLADELGMSENIVWIDRVNVSQLSALYSSALLTVVPSKVEGFGLVALEAMHCGCPVICTDLPVFREVCGDAAWYMEKLSAEFCSKAIHAVLASADERKAKVCTGVERAARFSRLAMAERTLRVYEKVLGREAPEVLATESLARAPVWASPQLLRG